MQSFRSRSVVLIVLLMAALAVTALADTADASVAPRWPADPASLQVDGWIAGAPSADPENGAVYVSRDYRNAASGVTATLTISTSPAAKRIYRAGPEVPFLGNGYVVESAPSTLVTQSGDRGALIARRGEERFLAIHTYGERRGRFDNGAIAWGLYAFDTALGRSNDYYLARVVIRLDGDDDNERGHLATALADDLFPRIAAWYSQT
jgi:hypothetical protein